ncbi:MAG: hypothetical protein AB1942_03465 [Pseudomonadota bacterium]
MQPHHHLHLATDFIWLGLLLTQLILVTRGGYASHRTIGLAVLALAPLLVATTAMLSVRSAHKGVVSGEGDFLIIQNVGVTLELALMIYLAFLLKKHRRLHGSLLMSTAILFMGIALFFALISFAPPFRIEGPETFYRFQTAAMTGQAICLAVGALFFLRDRNSGWPFLAAALCFPLNEAIRALLTRYDLIDPLTAFVGSLSQPLTFLAGFALLFALLASTVLPGARQSRIA